MQARIPHLSKARSCWKVAEEELECPSAAPPVLPQLAEPSWGVGGEGAGLRGLFKRQENV